MSRRRISRNGAAVGSRLDKDYSAKVEFKVNKFQSGRQHVPVMVRDEFGAVSQVVCDEKELAQHFKNDASLLKSKLHLVTITSAPKDTQNPAQSQGNSDTSLEQDNAALTQIDAQKKQEQKEMAALKSSLEIERDEIAKMREEMQAQMEQFQKMSQQMQLASEQQESDTEDDVEDDADDSDDDLSNSENAEATNPKVELKAKKDTSKKKKAKTTTRRKRVATAKK